MAAGINDGTLKGVTAEERRVARGVVTHRRLDWRPGWPHKAYKFTRSYYRGPALAHQRGADNVEPCQRCRNRSGPWQTCRSYGGIFRGECTNCRWGSYGASDCSLAQESKSSSGMAAIGVAG